MSGKDAVDVALVPRDQLLDLLRVTVGGGLDQLLRDVARHVRFEKLLEQSRQPF